MSVNADVLVRDYGWRCLRVEARDMRVEDVVLPGEYRGLKVRDAFMVGALTSANGAHQIRFWIDGGARWHFVHAQTEVVVLRAPEKRSPVAVEYPTPQAPTAEGDAP